MGPRSFAEAMAAVREHDEPEFVRPDWAERNEELAGFLLPEPPAGFLRHPAIRFQMFVDERYIEHELPYVRSRLPSTAALAEDPVGDPPLHRLAADGLSTSSNTVHHLHHLLRWQEVTGRELSQAATVVEWGAGYGNLAKLLVRLHGGAPTCVLVDTPVFSALQWHYLRSVLGDERVVLHTEPAEVRTGRVNVVPIGLVSGLDVAADLFVSTWALNESTPAAQRHVIERGWFGAPALLVAMHRGDPLEPEVLSAGATAVPLGPFMPGQHYFVR